MSLTSNTQIVSPSTGARNIQATPNATADNAVVSGTVYINSVVIDNTNNASADSFFKCWDASAPTVGTTVPSFVFKVGGAEKLYINFQKNRPKFTTALSFACVTAGGTGGTTSPSSSVSIGMVVQGADDAV